LEKDRRTKIFEAYYARNPETKELKNPGWPSYARGVLSKEEMQTIEDLDAQLFAWPKRLEKIKQVLIAQNADVLSLVELDAFEEIKRCMNQYGYSGEFVSRPRLVSKDGCGLFWKRSEFNLMAKSRLIFVDKYKPDPHKDRCALIVLLEHRSTKQQFAIASTHLARDTVNGSPRDAIRARQMGELAVHIREFLLNSSVSLYDCPVIICGDINAVSMAKLTGLVQVSALMAGTSNEQKLHPFVFASKAIDTRGVTSRTEAREVRVDAILYTTASVEAQGMELSSEIEWAKKECVIPNLVIPSDHFPLLARVGAMSHLARIAKAVRKWWSVVLPITRRNRGQMERQLIEDDPWVTDFQLDPRDLTLAFERIDVNASGKIEVSDALESLRRLDMLSSVSIKVREAWFMEQVLARCSHPDQGVDFVDFCAMYFLAHPVCARCANVAFDHIDASPRNDYVTMEELQSFFRPFDKSPLEGNAAELFEDAKARGLADDVKGMSRASFKTLLGARFVETMFDDPEMGRRIVERMGAARPRMTTEERRLKRGNSVMAKEGHSNSSTVIDS